MYSFISIQARITYWSTFWKIIYIIYSMDTFVKICWDLYLKIDTIHTDFHEYPFQVSKLSNIYPHLKFTLPGHNAPSPSHISIKLAIPNAKIHLTRSHNHPHATIPLVAPPNNRHVCGNKETLQTLAPPSLNICLANKLETKTWGEWLVEETDKDDRYRASHAPESSSRPSSTPIVAQSRFLFEIYLTLFNDVDSCGFFFLFKQQRIG